MSSVLTYKGHSARIEFDAEARIFFGRIAGIIGGVVFHATTVDDLVAAFHEAVDDYIETCAKIGKAPEKVYSGKLMLRVKPALHAHLAHAAELAGKSLNQFCSDALRAAIAHEAAQQLAFLGGSDPQATAGRRRRSALPR